jgi:predicted enzyme related to lactoylglutathione lyase
MRKADDIAEMHDKLIEAGGVIIEKGEFIPGSPYIFFKDPDGYMIEIWYELLPMAEG